MTPCFIITAAEWTWSGGGGENYITNAEVVCEMCKHLHLLRAEYYCDIASRATTFLADGIKHRSWKCLFPYVMCQELHNNISWFYNFSEILNLCVTLCEAGRHVSNRPVKKRLLFQSYISTNCDRVQPLSRTWSVSCPLCFFFKFPSVVFPSCRFSIVFKRVLLVSWQDVAKWNGIVIHEVRQ